MTHKLLEVRDLTVEFGVSPLARLFGRRRLRAVDGISFDVAAGEIVGIVGESGSGKTTTGRTLLRLQQSASGSIRFAGNEIAASGTRQLAPLRRHMQMIFQDPLSSLNPRHSVRHALSMPLRVHRINPPEGIDARTDDMLRRVGLTPRFKHRFPHELSGGQLQRVAIGRALMLDPQILVADEAVSKLDVSIRAQILNLLKDIQAERGLAVLFITHDLRVARFLCQRVLVMYFGRIVEAGGVDAIFDTPAHPYTRLLLGREQPHTAPAEHPSAGCNFYSRCPLRQGVCRIRRPPLLAVESGQLAACFAVNPPSNADQAPEDP